MVEGLALIVLSFLFAVAATAAPALAVGGVLAWLERLDALLGEERLGEERQGEENAHRTDELEACGCPSSYPRSSVLAFFFWSVGPLSPLMGIGGFRSR